MNLRLLSLTTACLALGACADRSTPSREPARHVLLISVDTLRAGHLSCYGGRAGLSPNIDGLAAAGARMTTTHAPMGMTLACVTSLMTSKYPDEHSVTYNQMQAPESEVLLSERLAGARFRTRALVANGVLAPEHSGLDQGYRNIKQDYLRIDDEEQLTKVAERLLRSDFGAEGREFLWLHYMAPHGPYTPPPATLAALDPDYTGDYDGTGATLDPVFVEKRALDDRDMRHIKACYDGEIATVDRLIGRVLAALDASGQADDTLVVFTADHAEELYDRNCYFYHANSLYGSVTHIPLLLRLPGRIAAGRVVEGLTELLDVLPTVLDYVAVPASTDPASRPRGSSLRRAIEGERVERQFTYCQVVNQIYGIRSDRWLYVRNPAGYRPVSVPEEGVYDIAPAELYDLRGDPREQHNVAAAHADVVTELDRRLDAWAYSLVRQRPKTGPRLSAERIRELEQLGYVQPRQTPPPKPSPQAPAEDDKRQHR